MHKGIERLKKERAFYITLLDGLSMEQLNKIPAGFNNNIAWNFGHLIATFQTILYLRAGVDIAIDEKYVLAYKNGTKPEQPVTEEEINTLKALMISTVDQFEKDYDKNLFSNYQTWNARNGIEIASIDDAITYALFHDGLHTGYTMSIKKLV